MPELRKAPRISLKLKTKLRLSFLVIGLLSVSVTGWQAFENARTALEKIPVDRLTSIRETKKHQIQTYFELRQNQVISLSSDRMVMEAVDRSTRSSSLWIPVPQTDSDYNELNRFFREYSDRFGYEDILIADIVSGNIIYSVRHKKDFGTNLRTGPFKETNIAEVFRQASLIEKDSASLVDFAPYAASNSMPSSFIAAPIRRNGRNIAVLIFQISIDHINRVMTSNNNWRSEGLGETGETYIVGADHKMRNDSRFFIQEPQQYFKMLLTYKADSALVQRIHANSTSILLQEVRTESAADALKGNTGTRIVSDYRGIQVLSSYTPLRIPGVRWVILAEIDTREAFSSITALRERLIVIALLILFLATGLSIFISRTISQPILVLAEATKRFGEGGYAQRADASSNDEIGFLATTFNRMADSITENTSRMKSEITDRMRAEEEVKVSRERLRNLSAHLHTVREEERKSLAREIHDQLGQALTTLKLQLALLKGELEGGNPVLQERVAGMMDMIDTTIKSVKRLITELRPRLLDDLGLTAAIEWQANEFSRLTGIPCELVVNPADIELDPDRSISIFRIFQETLTNISRHANATKVQVSLTKKSGVVELRVHDNGKGITAEELANPKSFGLLGMRERAGYWGGTLDIQGDSRNGTTLSVQFPLEEY